MEVYVVSFWRYIPFEEEDTSKIGIYLTYDEAKARLKSHVGESDNQHDYGDEQYGYLIEKWVVGSTNADVLESYDEHGRLVVDYDKYGRPIVIDED